MSIAKSIAVCGAMCLILSGCGQRVENSQSDELRAYTWSCEGEYGTSGTLSFEDEYCTLSIASSGGEYNIHGLAVCDDSRLVIADNSLKIELVFEYKLYGDRVSLTYEGESIDFVKEE